ncbi:MAG: FHA domain-containing protein [Planctomycetota bacterium]
MTAELVVVKGRDRGVSLPIKPDGVHTIGRSEGQDLRLKGDKKVSTSHAKITAQKGERFLIEDLGSTNGTYVNGERIQASPLRPGDRVKIGHTLMVFTLDASQVNVADLERADAEDGQKDPIETTTPAPDHARTKSKTGRSSGNVKKTKSAAAKSGVQQIDETLLAIGEALSEAKDLRGQLDRLIRIALHATGAARAILFVRDPDGGALGAATAIGRDGARESSPVDPDVLREAVAGNMAGPSGDAQAVAAPLKWGDRTIGALYLDDPAGRTPAPREAKLLATCASVIALALRADRLERLSETAIEVVGLAQTPANRAPIDLAPIVEAAARLYGPVAEAKGIKFDTRIQPVKIVGDETLVARAVDRLVESVLVSAKGTLRIELRAAGKIASVLVSRGGTPVPDALSNEIVAPAGPAADLKGALARLSDGGLALVRAAVARSGGRFLVEPGVPDMSGKFGTEKMGPAPAVTYVLELPAAGV